MEACEDIEAKLLLEAIHARYGYDFRGYARDSMRRRIDAALATSGLPHLSELTHRVLRDRELLANVLDCLTVRVSDLFRDPEVYRFFRARVVPLLRTYPQIKIWHAGCGEGEEAYTTAILLQEEGLADKTQIYATDLSQRAIRSAKDGVFPSARLATYRDNHAAAGGTSPLTTWLTEAYDRIAMASILRRNISFFQHDLATDHVFGEMQVVFCRNVLIYFGPELRERVLEKLVGSLCPGGFLCLGTSERLAGRSSIEKKLVPFGETERVYRYAP